MDLEEAVRMVREEITFGTGLPEWDAALETVLAALEYDARDPAHTNCRNAEEQLTTQRDIAEAAMEAAAAWQADRAAVCEARETAIRERDEARARVEEQNRALTGLAQEIGRLRAIIFPGDAAAFEEHMAAREAHWVAEVEGWKNQAQEIAQSNADHVKWHREAEADLAAEREKVSAFRKDFDAQDIKLGRFVQMMERIAEDVLPAPVRYADLTPEMVRDAFIKSWNAERECRAVEQWERDVAQLNLILERGRSAEIREALGLLTTLAPQMQMDPDHPMKMAQEIERVVRVERNRSERLADLLAETEGPPSWIERVRAALAPEVKP